VAGSFKNQLLRRLQILRNSIS